MLVDAESLAKNYDVVRDKLLSRSGDFVTTVVRESAPETGKDGLASLTTEAVVNVKAVQKSLNEMSRNERVEFIRASGDPRVAVRIVTRDADRARCAAAAVAGGREHPQGAHQVVRLPHVVRRTARARRQERARTSWSKARRRSSGCR